MKSVLLISTLSAAAGVTRPWSLRSETAKIFGYGRKKMSKSAVRRAIARSNITEPEDTLLAASLLLRQTDKGQVKQGIIEQVEPHSAGTYYKQLRAQHNEDSFHRLFLSTEITAGEYERALRALVNSAPTRFIGSGDYGIGKAMNHIRSHFLKNGLQNVHTQKIKVSGQNLLSFGLKGPETYNVIGEIPGREDCWTLLGAHYDSIPTSGDAPGAEDNGSGVAALLLATQKIDKESLPRCTMRFVAFTGEEEGLLGSKHYVSDIVNKQKSSTCHNIDRGDLDSIPQECKYLPKNCNGAIIMDEIAYAKTHSNKFTAIFETAANRNAAASHKWGVEQLMLVDIGAAALRTYNVDDNDVHHRKAYVNLYGFGSDHMSFMDACIPAVLVIDKDNMYFADMYGHRRDDDMDKIDFEHGALSQRELSFFQKLMSTTALRMFEHLANSAPVQFVRDGCGRRRARP